MIGLYNYDDSGGGGSGTVTSGGMTVNTYPYATAAQNIEDGLILNFPTNGNTVIKGALAVNANTEPVATAYLHIKGVEGGFLMPVLTSLERSAILLPANGLMVYQTDGGASNTGVYYFDGAIGANVWRRLIFQDTVVIGATVSGGLPGRVLFTDAVAKLAQSANITFIDPIFRARHLGGIGVAPTIAGGAGAGAAPVVAVAGTDLAGKISVTPGLLPVAGAIVATIFFNVAFVAPPVCVQLSPANPATNALLLVDQVFVNNALILVGDFKISNSGLGVLVAGVLYEWYYNVIA